jgi:hypothetical protein
MNTSRELPRYRCHKEVWALKIKAVEIKPDGMAILTPCDQRYEAFLVEKEYVDKHKPVADGYFVVYQDGYKSWSPAGPFESGYKGISDSAKEITD